jgi:hypothetical protein
MRRRQAFPRRTFFDVVDLEELVGGHQQDHGPDKSIQGKQPVVVLSFATMLSKGDGPHHLRSSRLSRRNNEFWGESGRRRTVSGGAQLCFIGSLSAQVTEPMAGKNVDVSEKRSP